MKQIKFVLLLISHQTYKPTDAEVNDFLSEKLPELYESKAQVVSYNITGTITPVTIRNIAIDVFGEEVADDSLYTYRTISFTISGGDGRIFVVYQRKKPFRSLRFRNLLRGRK